MTLSELAAHLNVSPASVSIVRHGRPGVSAVTRCRIQSALKANGYSYVPFVPFPNTGTDYSGSAPRCIRLLKYYRSAMLTDKNEGFVDAIIDAIDGIVRSKNYTLVFSSVSSDEYERFCNDLVTDHCIGLLVIATEMSREEIDKLRMAKVPIVILDCDHPALPFSSVTMDNRGLAYNAVLQLSSLGKVGYLRSRIRMGNFTARENGYMEAVRDLGLSMNDTLNFTLTPGLHAGCDDMKQLLDQGRRVPRAFFADNDVIAIGAMRALQLHGYRLPQDVSIIGVDNTILAQICMPALTSVQISCTTLGERAIQLLLDQIADPSAERVHVHIGTQLMIRESTPHLKL